MDARELEAAGQCLSQPRVRFIPQAARRAPQVAFSELVRKVTTCLIETQPLTRRDDALPARRVVEGSSVGVGVLFGHLRCSARRRAAPLPRAAAGFITSTCSSLWWVGFG